MRFPGRRVSVFVEPLCPADLQLLLDTPRSEADEISSVTHKHVAAFSVEICFPPSRSLAVSTAATWSHRRDAAGDRSTCSCNQHNLHKPRDDSRSVTLLTNQEGWSLETFMSSGRKVRTSRFLRMELARSRLSCSFTMFMCCMLCSSLSLLLLTLLNLVCTAPSKTVASSLLRFPLLRLIRHQLKAFSSSPTCQVPCLSYPTS